MAERKSFLGIKYGEPKKEKEVRKDLSGYAEAIDSDSLNFASYKDAAENIKAGSIANTERAITGSLLVSNLSRVKSIEDLQREKEGFATPNLLREISEELFQVDSNYRKIISYHKDMFHTRYTVTPFYPDGEKSILDKPEEYAEIMSIVDGMNLETLIPEMLKDIFISGVVNVYFDFDDDKNTVSTLFLPANLCRQSFKSSHGTNVIEFNFEYFDNFRGEEQEAIFELFPSEFQETYRSVASERDKWAALNPGNASSVQANEQGVPPFISALEGITEYQTVRDFELQKHGNELSKILVNEVPLDSDGVPIFEVDELKSITQSLRRVVSRHKGLDIITAFGKTSLHPLQQESRAENQRIQQAFGNIFSASGVNPALFAGKTDLSIQVSRDSDKTYVWSFIKEIELMLTVMFNNLYEGEMEAMFKFLPITMYDSSETIKSYRENAAFGIGKIDAVVASGIKQSKIQANSDLEKLLDLDNVLTPLQSAHTQKGAAKSSEEDDVEAKDKESLEKESEEVSEDAE